MKRFVGSSHLEKRQLQAMDQWIKQGQINRAKEALEELCRPGLDEEVSLNLAKLCRRCGLIQLGLRVLEGHSFDERGRPQYNSPNLIEYAALLARAGGGVEALTLMSKASDQSSSDAVFTQSAALINCGRFEAAISVLESFIAKHPSNEYSALVARLNIANSLIYLDAYDQVEPWLEEVLEHTEEQAFKLLRANSYELLCKACVARGQLDQASRFLDRAEKILSADEGFSDALYLLKWKAIIYDLQTKEPAGESEAFKQLQTRARKMKHFETLREYDLFMGILTYNSERLKKVYFGSPYPGTQAKALRYLKRQDQASSLSYTYKGEFSDLKASEPQCSEHLRSLSVGQSQITEQLSLKKGQVNDRLFQILTSDLYNPIPKLSVNARLFPDKALTPHQSIHCLDQAIFRLNEVFRRGKLRAKVHANDHRCILSLNGHYLVYGAAKEEDALSRLKRVFGEQTFKRKQVTAELGMSERSTSRWLQSAVESGHIEALGGGRSRSYRVQRV